MRAGKDTTYELIRGQSGQWKMPVVRLAYADGVKEEVFENILQPLGLCSSLEESLKDENRARFRPLWQLWGTEVRRLMSDNNVGAHAFALAQTLKPMVDAVQTRGSYWVVGPFEWSMKLLEPLVKDVDPEYWVKRLEYKLLAEGFADKIVVITDVRFPNEGRMVQRLDGYNVRILRPTEQPPDGVHLHASETAMDGWGEWDWTLLNEGTLTDLADQVSEMLIQLGIKELAHGEV